MKHTAFDRFHPAVALGYFAVLLVLSMAAMQPVYLVLSFAAAVAYSVVLRGARATARTILWQVPLIVILAVANPLFSASGSTELFRVGLRAVYAESVAYGACVGLMLAAVLLTFSNAAHVLTSDKVMALFGGAAPTVGLMLSMTARLVPQFVRRGRDIGGVQRACTAVTGGRAGVGTAGTGTARVAAGDAAGSRRGAGGRRLRMRENLRLTSVLMGWSMEDSLECADAMKARGWGACARRTAYARFRFRAADVVALVVGGALAVLAAAAAWQACAAFSFYPRIGGFAPWYSYLPYALFAVLPLILEAKERLRWRP